MILLGNFIMKLLGNYTPKDRNVSSLDDDGFKDWLRISEKEQINLNQR